MRNTYPGICFVCNTPVAAGDGHFTKKGGQGKWRVKHWFHGEKVKGWSKAIKAEKKHNASSPTQVKRE